MPAFPDFDYFFAIDILKISKFTLSLSGIIGCVFTLLWPSIYQKFLRDSEYSNMFCISQVLYIVQAALFMCMALRLNLIIGFPDMAAYLIFGPVVHTLEKCLTYMPMFIIMAKIIPPGVEATFMSLASTIHVLNQHTMRVIVGVIINDNTIDVTKEHFDGYYKLQIIAGVGAMIPLLYIYRMVPKVLEVKELQDKNIQKIKTIQ